MADEKKAAGDNLPEKLSLMSSTTNGDENPVTEIQQRSPPADDDVTQEAPAAKPRAESEAEVNPAAAAQAFRSLRGDLMTAIVDTLPLANTLYSKFMIPESTMNRVVVSCLAKEEKNVALLHAIEARLRTHPSDFWILVAVLEADPILQIFAKKLRETYYLASASHESPTPVPCSPVIARYADFLKAYYRTAPVAPDIPECCKWPLTPSIQYINLAVVKKEHTSRAEAEKFTKATVHGNIDEILNVKKAVRMEDVLKPEGEAEVKRVLVEGAPGVGKSTFAWELCRRWDEIEAMRKYSVVVLLRLREKRVQEAKTVADLFYHDSPSIQQAVAEEIASNGGADTLLVLDGFDEVPASFRKSSLLVQIIHGACLPKATVLVTSRPSARADLLAVCKPQVYKHIEILGFTHEQIEQYATSIFASARSLLADFLKYISAHQAIRSMMYIPLNSAIVVEIYRENRTVGRPIPQTMTQLYNELTLILLRRYLSEKGEHPVLPEKLEDLPRNLYRQLFSLAKLAFEGTVKQEVIFDRLPDGCSPLGMMNASAELYVRGRSFSYNFLHLTLQEFLSAFYVSQLPAGEQKEVGMRHSDDLSGVPVHGEYNMIKRKFSHMDTVWMFMAGLTGFKNIGWDAVQSRTRMYKTEFGYHKVNEGAYFVVKEGNERGRVTPFLVDCLYEAQEKVDCKSVLGGSKVTLSSNVIDFNFFAVGYCIAGSKCAWELLLQNTNCCLSCLGAEMVKLLVCGMKSEKAVRGSIEELILNGQPIKQEGVAHLKEMPCNVLQQMSTLEICNCQLDGAALDLLSDIIPIMTSLKHLHISGNPVGPGGAVKLLQALEHLHSLHTLGMVNTNIGCDDIMALSQLIRPTGCLKELSIGDENMPPECAELMMKTVLSPSSLKSLAVQCLFNGMYRSNLNSVYSPLIKNRNLTNLCCCLKISCLAEALHNNDTLKELEIVNQEIETEEAMALSEMLKVNRSLEKLRLVRDQSLGESEVRALINSLRYNHTLKHLQLHAVHFRHFVGDTRDDSIRMAAARALIEAIRFTSGNQELLVARYELDYRVEWFIHPSKQLYIIYSLP